MSAVLDRLRKLLDFYIRSVQKVLITLFLALTYFLAMGATCVLALAFKRELLRDSQQDRSTYWTEAEDYEPDVEDCLRQS